MATTTTTPDITSTTPVLLVSGASSALVQLQSEGPLRVYVGASAPADNTDGLILSRDELSVVTFFDLVSGTDEVYASLMDDDADPVTVSVVKTS